MLERPIGATECRVLLTVDHGSTRTALQCSSGKGHTSCMLLESLSRSYSDNPRRLQMIPDVLLKEVRLLLKSRLSEIKSAFRSSKNNKRPWLS